MSSQSRMLNEILGRASSANSAQSAPSFLTLRVNHTIISLKQQHCDGEFAPRLNPRDWPGKFREITVHEEEEQAQDLRDGI